jgi:hypothetical protein
LYYETLIQFAGDMRRRRRKKMMMMMMMMKKILCRFDWDLDVRTKYMH